MSVKTHDSPHSVPQTDDMIEIDDIVEKTKTADQAVKNIQSIANKTREIKAVRDELQLSSRRRKAGPDGRTRVRIPRKMKAVFQKMIKLKKEHPQTDKTIKTDEITVSTMVYPVVYPDVQKTTPEHGKMKVVSLDELPPHAIKAATARSKQRNTWGGNMGLGSSRGDKKFFGKGDRRIFNLYN